MGKGWGDGGRKEGLRKGAEKACFSLLKNQLSLWSCFHMIPHDITF